METPEKIIFCLLLFLTTEWSKPLFYVLQLTTVTEALHVTSQIHIHII